MSAAKNNTVLFDLERSYKGSLRPYCESPVDNDALSLHEAAPATSLHSRVVHRVVCGECMAGRSINGGVFEAISHDAQAAANALRAHYKSDHP